MLISFYKNLKGNQAPEGAFIGSPKIFRTVEVPLL
jgi:hypothetical protein